MLDEARCWEAVLARDSELDGRFVYAVRSTGVYCRPSCPARRPGRNQVSFYAAPEVAEQHGFRACRRCQPNDGSEDAGLRLARQVCQQLDRLRDEAPTLASLGAALGVSPYHLQRTFKRVVGITPRQYAAARRLERLKYALRDGDAVAGALYDAGFSSSSRLYETAAADMGMTPGRYRRGGQAMRIHYTVVPCARGRLLVGATARGICAVSLGDDDAELARALREEYPAAEIERDDRSLTGLVTPIVRHLAGELPTLDLPTDVQATAFQRRVWDALKAIPYGETRTYGQVASALGCPTAARAVARACATNPVAVVVPCHRVIRSDGGLGGYRWGIERKASMLRDEQH